MDSRIDEINQYLVTIFNEVMTIEEDALKGSEFQDISIKEMHTIEAIGMYSQHTITQVANKLCVTVGTMTVAINNLEKKGYVERVRSKEDRRVVKLSLTNKGRLLYRLHDKFHRDMVKDTIEEMNPEETVQLLKGLQNLHHFLEKTKNKLPEE